MGTMTKIGAAVFGMRTRIRAAVVPVLWGLTHALVLIILVDEDVVQDEGEQLVLQAAVGVED